MSGFRWSDSGAVEQHFILSFRTGVPAGEESALAGLKQIPRAIKLPFGMTLFKLPHYPFFRLGPFFGVESAWITAGGRGTLLSR